MKLLGALVFLAVSPGLAQECAWTLRDAEFPDFVGGGLAYDSQRAVTVMFGGFKQGGPTETWEWDGLQWVFRTDDSPPRNGDSRSIVYDSERNVTVLYDGEDSTWEWDGQTWVEYLVDPDPEERELFSMAYDSDRGVVVLFGGFRFDPNGPGELLGDTWEWDGVEWRLAATEGPSPSAFNSMAFDPERGVTVLYGVSNDGETWEWDGAAWVQRLAKSPPGVLAEAAMVYDADLRACVLYGGSCAPFCNNSPSDETWAWNGQSWMKLDTPVNPGRRYRHAMAYDSARHTIVLFGGLDAGKNLLHDTWEFACEPPPCYPDFDGSGGLDLFDFLAFVNAFNAQDPESDCDKSQSLDLFDFLCFANAFGEGC